MQSFIPVSPLLLDLYIVKWNNQMEFKLYSHISISPIFKLYHEDVKVYYTPYFIEINKVVAEVSD